MARSQVLKDPEDMPRYHQLFDDRRSADRGHLGSPVDDRGEEIDPWQFDDGKVLDLGCVPRFPIDIPGRPDKLGEDRSL